MDKGQSIKICLRAKEKIQLVMNGFSLMMGIKRHWFESFTNSDATVQRFKNHGASPIANEVVEFVDFEAVYCFGNPKDDLKEMLGAWGAIIQNHFCGFNHS